MGEARPKSPGSLDVVAVALSRADAESTPHTTVGIHIEVRGRWEACEAMVDSGATINFISQLFVKQLGLSVESTERRKVSLLSGSPLRTYGTHAVTYRLRDTKGQEITSVSPFLAADMHPYVMILGKPWLQQHNPDFHWDSNTWQWRTALTTSAANRVELLEADEFAQELAEGHLFLATATDLRTPARSADPAYSFCGASPTRLPAEYQDLARVFSEDEANELAEHGSHDHEIDTEGHQPPFGPLYNLSADELKVLREYIDENLAKGFIRPSTSPAGAPILFVKKKDGSLRLCVDYRGLNKITKKNRYPLPLISEALDRVSGAKIYSKLDIRAAYNQIRIRDGDEWKTAFRTRYGHFEYCVMPFGLANAPATFQGHINNVLRDFLDVFVIAYLDDILIFSTDVRSHTRDVRRVLERLLQHRLFVKLEKCLFSVPEVDFVGFVLTTNGVAMETSRVQTIEEWPVPRKHRDVQVFLGFANFYRRFISGYSLIARALNELLRGGKDGKFLGPFEMNPEALDAFSRLKAAFTKAPLLQHFNPEAPLRLETDASKYAIAGILSQPANDDPTQKHYHPIAFWSRSMTMAERNYSVGETELLAIVKACEHWRHYIQGAQHIVDVLTDHANLQTLLVNKDLRGRLARWYRDLCPLPLRITYRQGKHNPADGPSRRPDYEATPPPGDPEEDEAPVRRLQFAGGSSGNTLGDRRLPEADRQGDPSTNLQLSIASEKHNRNRTPPTTAQTGPGDTGGRHPHAGRPLHEGELQGEVPNVGRFLLAAASERKRRISRDEWLSTPVAETSNDSEQPTESLVELVSRLQQEDPECERIRPLLQATGPTGRPRRTAVAGDSKLVDTRWSKGASGALYYDERLYVPAQSNARAEILQRYHDDPHAGHFGRQRTYENIRRQYYWPKMDREIEEYVRTCTVCRRSKATRHKPYGEMGLLPPPGGPWEDIAMDFITDLPPSVDGDKPYDSILVIVDRCTRMAHYIPALKTWSAEQLAKAFHGEIFRLHGLPTSIVSDRGPVFTSNFWSAFCFHLKVKRKLSTAFHPQTDGQTERQNQTLEQYLRAYINYQQDDWVAYLPDAEFAYNNSIHSETGKTPFYLLYGKHPRADEQLPDASEATVPAAFERIQKIQEVRANLTKQYERAKATQARYYDKKHTPRLYAAGDRVWLAARNIRSRRPHQKLDHKYYGPYEVESAVGKQAYRLALPATMGRIHNVFHVSLLEPYSQRDGEQVDPPLSLLVDGEEEWGIDAVVGDRVARHGPEYLVKWTGYPDSERSWLPEAEFANAQEVLDVYRRSRAARKRALEKEGVPEKGAKRRTTRKR